MALPLSGPLSLSQIQTEFGGTNPISLNEYYRGGAFVTSNNTNVPTSGVIRVSNFYGATKQFALVISSNYSTPQNLRALVVAAGWNGTDAVLVTNNAIISSNTTGTPALTINGSFPNGLVFVNNNYVVGMGGFGAQYDNPGSPGGAAMAVSTAVSITNNGTIAGGGGGGGAGSSWGWNGLIRSTPGSGGASGLTQAGAYGPIYGGGYGDVGGQPSQFNGATGMYSTPGASQNWGYGGRVSSYGGAGGTWGVQGQQGGSPDGGAGGGYLGGAGGACLTGVAFVTWLANGTRLGPIS